jgi:hypothetical protein
MVSVNATNDTVDNWPSVMFPPELFVLSGLRSYSYLCGAGSTIDARLIEIPESRLRSVLGILLNLVKVDEAWYIETNPDVANAIRAGEIASARTHYCIAGFYENRWPFPIIVDESWYRTEYPDVQTAITRGGVESCQDHFNRYGFLEGRLPSKDWSLVSYQPARTDGQKA